jgi:hypothetical protein
MNTIRNLWVPVRFQVLTAVSMKMNWVAGLLHHVVWQKFTIVSEVLAASIIRVMSPYDGGSQCL